MTPSSDDQWLKRFHAGHRDAIEDCYRDHFDTVDAAVGRVLWGADRETVVHEIFCMLIEKASVREQFTGGSMSAWLRTIARHRAIDFLRKYRRESAMEEEQLASSYNEKRIEQQAEARRILERLHAEIPKKWAQVFQTRFIEQLSQREAATRLGIRRTTLAYQELRIRALIRHLILEKSMP